MNVRNNSGRRFFVPSRCLFYIAATGDVAGFANDSLDEFSARQETQLNDCNYGAHFCDLRSLAPTCRDRKRNGKRVARAEKERERKRERESAAALIDPCSSIFSDTGEFKFVITRYSKPEERDGAWEGAGENLERERCTRARSHRRSASGFAIQTEPRRILRGFRCNPGERGRGTSPGSSFWHCRFPPPQLLPVVTAAARLSRGPASASSPLPPPAFRHRIPYPVSFAYNLVSRLHNNRPWLGSNGVFRVLTPLRAIPVF